MALQMKPACERCGKATPEDGEAFICSYECTFCRRCSLDMNLTCPNCGGELLTRPRRQAKEGVYPLSAAKLAGFGLAQAAINLSRSTELASFALVEVGTLRKQMNVEGSRQEEAIMRGRTHLSAAQANLDRWAFVHEGTDGVPGEQGSIAVEIWDRTDPRIAVLMQTYQPSDQGYGFRLIGKPKLMLDGNPVSDEDARDFFGAAEEGIASHEEAAKLWDNWNQLDSVQSW